MAGLRSDLGRRIVGDADQETEALAAFDRWLQTIHDDEHVVDEESGLADRHLHTIRDMAALGAERRKAPRG